MEYHFKTSTSKIFPFFVFINRKNIEEEIQFLRQCRTLAEIWSLILQIELIKYNNIIRLLDDNDEFRLWLFS